jgi:hypothetical protein
MFNKIYGVVSLLFILMIFSQTFIVDQLKLPLLVKILDYGFWFSFGAFSALFVLTKVNKGFGDNFIKKKGR